MLPPLFLFLSLVPRFSFSGAGRRGGVSVPPFLHLTPLFALQRISSAVTYPRLPFHLLFDLMRHNEGKRPKAALLQLRASTKTYLSRAPVKPPSCRSPAVMQPREKTPDLQAGCREAPEV